MARLPQRSRVILAPAATRDLAAIKAWLTQPGAGEAAARRLRRITQAIRTLSLEAVQWPAGLHAGTRERPVGAYRIVYEVISTEDDTTRGEMRIVRVFGPGQDRSNL